MKYFNIYLSLVMLAMIACDPIEDRDAMPSPMNKSQLDFSVEQNPDRPNELFLRSSTEGAIAFWDYEVGVSNEPNVDVLIPFEGEFWVKYYAYSGGVPTVDSSMVSLPQDEEYFNDPIWDLLTNGSDGKTWVWATGNPVGPLMGIGPLDINNWNPFGGFEWWNTTDVEEGKFILDLNKGFNYTKITPDATQKGKFSVYEENGITYIKFQGPKMLNQEGDNTQSLYGISKINENELVLNQLYLADNSQRTYYFKKEGFDGPWVTEEKDPDPNFDHGDQIEILTDNATRTWKLDTEVPFNWIDLEGNLLNDWYSRADYPDWGGVLFSDDDVENIDDASIAFSNDGTVVVTQDDGTTEEGTYAIDEETNTITFTDIEPSIRITHRNEEEFIANTTADNQWKIVIVERNESDEVTGIWLGKRDPVKDEYFAFHFLLN